jgi:hypothetical protein
MPQGGTADGIRGDEEDGYRTSDTAVVGRDKEGRAIRDPDSTTYTGAIETAEEFGRRIYAEASRRGWSRALLKVVMGDGAEWIWNIADLHFPGAIQIVDL